MSESTAAQYAVVEVMGHQTYAGQVAEVQVFGTTLLRVIVPEVDGQQSFTKDIAPAALYAVTYTTEEVARLTAQHLNAKPLSVYIPELAERQELRAENEKLKTAVQALSRGLPAASRRAAGLDEAEWREARD